MIAPPRDLTLPGPGSTTATEVLSHALRRALGDLGRLPLSRASSQVASSLRAVLSATKRELGVEPGRVLGALRRPNVSTPIRILRALPPDAERAQVDSLSSQLAATLAVELAAAGAELPDLSFPVAPPRVVCLGQRFVIPGGRARLAAGRWITDDVEVDLARPGADVERPFFPIEHALVLSTVDDNPLAMREAHPDKQGNAVDLGGRTPEAWCAALREALFVIEEHLPEIRREVDVVLHQIVPVGYDERAHLSASYQEAIGTIYLTLHPRLMTMTEAIIHELSHNALNALFELDPLLENAFSPLFTSPVRPDPRPLHGILLAVHAFLPIEALYRRMIERNDPRARGPEVARRYAQIMAVNREGAAVLLANARPTAIGRGLLEEIARLVDQPLPDAA